MFNVDQGKFEPDKIEQEILEFWQRNNIFEKTQKPGQNQKGFVFYEGPPTANGKPGIHHIMARSFKDIFLRYKSMCGFFVLRKGGWDTHGLPVELQVEKELGLSGKKQIEEYGIEKFNNKCRESVLRYIEDWEKVTNRIGFWIDTKNAYMTFDPKFIETEWWILKQLWEKKLLVKDYKVVPYCYRCQTPLSSHEVAQGYEDVDEQSVYVKFELCKERGVFFLAWTTTPWTLLGNVALAINPKAVYVKIRAEDKVLILAKDRLGVIKTSYEILSEFLGNQLVGLAYNPIFNFVKYKDKAHYVVEADFVKTDEGTGIVHTAVMYGEDDFILGRKNNLPEKHCVNLDGRFSQECGIYSGKLAKKSQEEIIADLKSRDLLYRTEIINHAYPFCWRCHTPLLYYALDSWFIKTTKVKDSLIRVNNKVKWQPPHIKKGRMGNWLATLIDWSISRNRYWGTPLPIWQCPNCHHEICLGSFQEAADYNAEIGKDPHRPYIDKIKLTCPECRKLMVRVSEVIDCWFDSGAMPFAQWHYPFENKKLFEEQFPADFISEAMDQTRGWFFTLMAISTLIKDRNCYKNVVCNGLVLDEKGQKMSKHIGNVIDPWKIISQYGADSLRWYFYSSVRSGDNYRFSEKYLRDINAKIFLVIWNVYKFFALYANIDKWQQKDINTNNLSVLDSWILSRLNNLIRSVTDSLEGYDSFTATQDITKFLDDLSNWYIRRSRDRVGPTISDSDDKEAFYQTTYFVLTTLVRLLAPFAPFFAEKIFQLISNNSKDNGLSVHLSNWPAQADCLDPQLEEEMAAARQLCEFGHRERKDLGIKVRQPLPSIKIEDKKRITNNRISKLIEEELNVKSILWVSKGKGNLKVTFDTNIDDDLKREGELRELIRKVQELRKEAGCPLEAKIHIFMPDKLNPSEKGQLAKKTLAEKIIPGSRLKIKVV